MSLVNFVYSFILCWSFWSFIQKIWKRYYWKESLKCTNQRSPVWLWAEQTLGRWEEGSEVENEYCICRFVEETGLVPFSFSWELTFASYSSPRGSSILLWPLRAPEQTWHTFTGTHRYIHNRKVNFFFKVMRADSQTDERDTEKSRRGAVLWGQEILPVMYSAFVHEPQHLCPPWKEGTSYWCGRVVSIPSIIF